MPRFSLLLTLPLVLLTLPNSYGSLPRALPVTPEPTLGIRALLSSNEVAEIQAGYNNLSKSLALQIPEILKPLEALGLRSISANIRSRTRASADSQ